MKGKLHLAIGHYSIGYRDGVNTVLVRTVRGLKDIDPSLKITVFGKPSPLIESFLPWDRGKLDYVGMEELDTHHTMPGLGGMGIEEQDAHDYVWLGTKIAKKFGKLFADVDVVIMENLSIGVHPAVTYAFFLTAMDNYNRSTTRRFISRVHDFAQQRPRNFQNMKKFHDYRFGYVPDWHEVLYPNMPNVDYISINTADMDRLLDHGIDRDRISYIPNCIDDSLLVPDDKGQELRRLLQNKEGIEEDTCLIFYPVRCIPRKNVEEAIFITMLLNNLTKMDFYKSKYNLMPKYHLLVSLEATTGDEKKYTDTLKDFVKKHRLPVTIGLGDWVALKREYDIVDGERRLTKFGVADAYAMADVVITTSYLEGFGFVFIEPWVLDRCVIGRNIPQVTPDFQRAGMHLDHFYTVLRVDGRDFKELGMDQGPNKALQVRLAEILKLGSQDYVEKIMAQNVVPLKGTLRIMHTNKGVSVRKTNKKVVMDNYSQSRISEQVYRVIRGWEGEK